MKRQYLHPDASVGASSGNRWSQLGTNLSNKWAQQSWSNLTGEYGNDIDIGGLLNGDGTSTATNLVSSNADRLLGNMFGDSTAGVVISSALKTVLMAVIGGDFSAPNSEIDKAKQSATEAKKYNDAANELGIQTGNKAKELADINIQLFDGYSENMKEMIAQADQRTQEVTDLITTNKELADENTAKMLENNKKIKETTEQIAERSQTIENRKQELKNETKNGDGTQKPNIADDSIINGELRQIDGLESLIGDYSADNFVLAENIQTSMAQTSEQVTNAASENENTSMSVDEMSNLMVQGYKDFESGMSELKNFMQGNLPKFDKAMAQKITELTTKAAINGVNSGTLYAMAATFGLGSVVSFGATADKAANATQGGVKYNIASVGDAASAALEKVIKQQIKSYLTQQISQLSDRIDFTGGYLNEVFDTAMAEVDSSMFKDVDTKTAENTVEQNEKQTETAVELAEDAKGGVT